MNISALLDALKGREKDGKNSTSDLLGGDDGGTPVGMKVSVLKAKPIDGDPSDDMPGAPDDPSDDMPPDMGDMMGGDDQDEAEDEDETKDAKISAALQVKFPEIYKQLEQELDDQGDDSGEAMPQ